MKQLTPFNPANGGSIAGWCLQNVRRGYGIGVKYPNAITAWSKTQQHKDRNFPALDIPLFYSYKVDGHINVRLADGRIWNDGRIFQSMATFQAAWSNVTYLGWGESINDVKIIEEGDMSTTTGHVDKVFKMGFGRPPRADELNNPAYVKDLAFCVDTVWANGGETNFNFDMNDKIVNQGDAGNLVTMGVPQEIAQKCVGKSWKYAVYEDLKPLFSGSNCTADERAFLDAHAKICK